MRIVYGLVGLLMCGTATSAVLAQDVVMRRPLPHARATSSQDQCAPGQPGCPVVTPTPTPGSTPDGTPPPTPTPTPTPTPSTPAPTPTPVSETPNLDDDPVGPADPDPDFCEQVNADGTGYCDEYSYCKEDWSSCGSFEYEWRVGPWQGGGSCGEESTMTRSVSCVRREMQTDWSNEGGPMMEVGTSVVSADMCESWGLEKPSSRYTGTRANCERETVVENGAWLSTCSADTQREQIVKCMEGGKEVPGAWCAEDIRTGGAPLALPEPIRGENYESCQLRWATSTRATGCEPERATPGGAPAVARTYNSYTCEFFDSSTYQWTYAEDDFCTSRNLPKPEETIASETVCTVKYSAQYSACGGAVIAQTERNYYAQYPNSGWMDGAETTRFCRAANATCCEYEHRPNRTRVIIRATNGKANGIDGWAGNTHAGDFYWDWQGDQY